MLCVGLLLAYCFSPPAISTDSFCSVYNRVIVEQGDSAISARGTVKRRIAANDVTYRCLCTGWKNKLCENRQ
jgi:hypothetical protein